jgi:GT2 family glycosyltransferase
MDLTVAVAVITRNRPGPLRRCLEHLSRQTVAPAEIVVVDSSDDERSREVCQEFPDLLYIRFPGGRHQMPTSRNLALVHSSSEVVAYLDDDCLADRDWLEWLTITYQEQPAASGVGGRISDKRWAYDPTQPIGQVDELGRVISNFFGDPGCVPEVDWLPGGSMSFRRSVLMAAGGFDPGYVATNHREDPDLCLRVRALGGKLYYQPKAHLWHLNARTTLGELRPWHEFYLRYSFARNDTYFVIKHFGDCPPAVRRTLLTDSARFVGQALRRRPAMAVATLPVFFVAKAIGLATGFRSRFYMAHGRRINHLNSIRPMQAKGGSCLSQPFC